MAQPRLLRCSKLIPDATRLRRVFTHDQPAIESVEDRDKVVVSGYVRSIRNQKTRSFASIGDGSSLEPLQALLTPLQAERQVHQTPILLHLLIAGEVYRLAQR